MWHKDDPLAGWCPSLQLTSMKYSPNRMGHWAFAGFLILLCMAGLASVFFMVGGPGLLVAAFKYSTCVFGTSLLFRPLTRNQLLVAAISLGVVLSIFFFLIGWAYLDPSGSNTSAPSLSEFALDSGVALSFLIWVIAIAALSGAILFTSSVLSRYLQEKEVADSGTEFLFFVVKPVVVFLAGTSLCILGRLELVSMADIGSWSLWLILVIAIARLWFIASRMLANRRRTAEDR